MQYEFTDEQRMLREMVRAFAREEVAPLAREIDREERFPRESWEAEARSWGCSGPRRRSTAAPTSA